MVQTRILPCFCRHSTALDGINRTCLYCVTIHLFVPDSDSVANCATILYNFDVTLHITDLFFCLYSYNVLYNVQGSEIADLFNVLFVLCSTFWNVVTLLSSIQPTCLNICSWAFQETNQSHKLVENGNFHFVRSLDNFYSSIVFLLYLIYHNNFKASQIYSR